MYENPPTRQETLLRSHSVAGYALPSAMRLVSCAESFISEANLMVITFAGSDSIYREAEDGGSAMGDGERATETRGPDQDPVQRLPCIDHSQSIPALCLLPLLSIDGFLAKTVL